MRPKAPALSSHGFDRCRVIGGLFGLPFLASRSSYIQLGCIQLFRRVVLVGSTNTSSHDRDVPGLALQADLCNQMCSNLKRLHDSQLFVSVSCLRRCCALQTNLVPGRKEGLFTFLDRPRTGFRLT